MPSYLITGASRGIGLEFVRQLSASTDNVVFALARNVSGATALNELASGRSNIRVLQADIVDVLALKIAAAEVAKVTGGGLDYLINNAALLDPGPGRSAYTLSEYANGQEHLLEKDIQDSIQVNVIGVIHTVNAFLPLLRNGNVKKVISLSTGVADPDFVIATGHSVSAAYSISKAALNMAVAKYAAEFKDEGFVFLAVSPGLVDTSTAPPTPKELLSVVKMIDMFKQAAPHWNGLPITPEVSVKYILKLIETASAKDNGAFVSHLGNKQWL